jgi:heme/copper-type cytochrome/quinol oxidase subunit 2
MSRNLQRLNVRFNRTGSDFHASANKEHQDEDEKGGEFDISNIYFIVFGAIVLAVVIFAICCRWRYTAKHARQKSKDSDGSC